ncbi:hypothetical protein F0L17_14660 [Streptomyces sp. TRM43335]|uniref:Uncharacterized protein n=1 Tax=Streptomyces taklimakanensis TaxID=2569853 RepID=A0A6G2BDH8_9ACTN|nr:hypothetical protein [Streptomyces taklimakanensis]MTE20327.1 hypothetical protein [Streptomyces taklimakanensis]
MQIPPIGARVWIACAAHLELGIPAWHGDATVTRRIPCGPCWRNAAYRGRWTSATDIYTAARDCQEPTGYIARTDDGTQINVVNGDTGVLAVLLATETGSVAA